MGLETGTRIEDLVPANPLVGDNVNQGDDHIRLIKTCLQGSFPSLGPDAVTATALDINKLNSSNINNEFVRSFNARTGVVVPAADDYAIGQMSDVDLTTEAPAALDLLQYDGTDWVPVPGPVVGYCRYSGLGGFVSDQIYFTNEIINSFPFDGLGTITNAISAGATGFTFTANRNCLFTAHFNVSYVGASAEVRADIQVNGTPVYAGSSTAAGRSSIEDSSSGNEAFVGISGTQALSSGDYINLYLRDFDGTANIVNFTMSVLPCSFGP